MRIDFVTLFPTAVLSAVRESILGRAEGRGIVQFGAMNPRDFASDAHKTVDDAPYGGGPGMVMKPDVVAAAIRSVLSPVSTIVYPDPAGRKFDQAVARQLAEASHLVFVCGHYEGIDERVMEAFPGERLSIGDFVVTGGEWPAVLMADAVVRLLPDVLGCQDSLAEDAFSDGLLTYPQYTRPEVWEGRPVPEVLLTGDHGRIRAWRRMMRLKATRERRPDLFARAPLSKSDLKLLE